MNCPASGEGIHAAVLGTRSLHAPRAPGIIRVQCRLSPGYEAGFMRVYEAGFSLLTFKSSSFRADFGTGAEFETLEQQRTQARLC